MFSSKGKQPVVDVDYDDLDPQISYRHLQPTHISVNHPLRVIALVDSDAFYAACEIVRLGLDRDTPLVVLQWSSFIAVNYPARKYGISRFGKDVLTVDEAIKRCPQLKVVHVATYKEGEDEPGYWEKPDSRTHKVSLDYYRRESKKIHTLITSGVPTGISERASIDEAFIDFTRPVINVMLQRYPNLRNVPEDSKHGLDTPLPPPPPISWEGLGFLIPTAELQSDSGTEPSDSEFRTWHDVALSIAAELMNNIRANIDGTLGYTTSAGVARNKFLAKLCASQRKPNGQSILRNAAIPNFLRPLPFQKIRFLGGKLGKAIAEEFEASTVGDLLEIGIDEMQNKLGENAVWIYELLRGVDRSEVKEKPEQMKSMLASKNLPTPIIKESDGYHWIRVLATELSLRLNDSRKITPTLWPKALVLHARRGCESARSKQTAFPFVREVTTDVIVVLANKLWKGLIGNHLGGPLKITSVQLSFTGIECADSSQPSIESFLTAGTKRSRHEAFTEDATEGPCSPYYLCDECGKQIAIPNFSNLHEEEHSQALMNVRMEHADFHFAQKLAKEVEPSAQQQTSPIGQRSIKQRRKEGGIASFFSSTA